MLGLLTAMQRRQDSVALPSKRHSRGPCPFPPATLNGAMQRALSSTFGVRRAAFAVAASPPAMG